MSKFFISDKFLETAVAKTTRVDMRLWRNKECRKKKKYDLAPLLRIGPKMPFQILFLISSHYNYESTNSDLKGLTSKISKIIFALQRYHFFMLRSN